MEDRLFSAGYAFDFFQAVRLLQRLDSRRRPVGYGGSPAAESVRFRAHLSTAFPPSSIAELSRPSAGQPVPVLVQAFLGLTGPSGVLPRHYTELLLRLERESKASERGALRDWLDLFNHRLVSLFYRAWEKYRFYLPFERGEPDLFTQGLFSLVGLGLPSLRDRLHVSVPSSGGDRVRDLSRVEDLALVYYSGLLAHRPRCVSGLEALLADYFRLPVTVRQFQGQWFYLEPGNQSRLREEESNNQLGTTALVGERVWDRQNKFRVRVGPLDAAQFEEFLPDLTPQPERKAFFALVDLVRLYAGPTLDFDVQLVLKAEQVPECRLSVGDGDLGGSRLGWNSWLQGQGSACDREDAVFEGESVSFVVLASAPLAVAR